MPTPKPLTFDFFFLDILILNLLIQALVFVDVKSKSKKRKLQLLTALCGESWKSIFTLSGSLGYTFGQAYSPNGQCNPCGSLCLLP